MKTDTELLNSLTNTEAGSYLHQLTQEESARMKKMLLIIYNDFAELCEKQKITFMLGGGSCLGAIRHHGFIPWDDDLDIMMPRKDYENLIEVLKSGALGDKYEINYPTKTTDCKNTFLKIYRKGTLDNELFNENTPFPRGIFLDIFPMDSAPKSKLARRIRGVISDGLQFVATCVLYAQYPSDKYKRFVSGDEDTKRRFQLRIKIGNICKIIPHRLWVHWFDKFNSSDKATGYTTIPTGRKHYVGETQPTSVFLPVRYEKFEGMDCPIPGNAEVYLTALYGDFMKLPPEDKRERHLVYQFKCDLPE